MRPTTILYSFAIAAALGVTSCTTFKSGAGDSPTAASGDLDQQIQDATGELEDLQTARRMMTRGAADGTPDTAEIDKKIKAATDRLEDLKTARRMMSRGNAG